MDQAIPVQCESDIWYGHSMAYLDFAINEGKHGNATGFIKIRVEGHLVSAEFSSGQLRVQFTGINLTSANVGVEYRLMNEYKLAASLAKLANIYTPVHPDLVREAIMDFFKKLVNTR